MYIKSSDGTSHDVASKGSGNTGIALGASALGVALLAGGRRRGLFGGLLGGEEDDRECRRDVQRMAEKDAMIASLAAERYTDDRLLEAERRREAKFSEVEKEIALLQAHDEVVSERQTAFERDVNRRFTETAVAIGKAAGDAYKDAVHWVERQAYARTTPVIPSTSIWTPPTGLVIADATATINPS